MHIGLGLYRHMLTPDYYAFARQAGATHVVIHLVDYFNNGSDNPRHNQPTGGRNQPWGYAGDPAALWTVEELRRIRREIEDAGLVLAAIENLDPAHWHDVLLDGPERARHIGNVKTIVRNMGEAGIPVLGYNFSIAGVAGRVAGPWGRGGALTVGMDGPVDDPLPAGVVWNMIYDADAKGVTPAATHDQLWDRLRRFLEDVVPVAEQAGVRLAAHPDDPPLPFVRQQPRLVYQPSMYQRLIDLKPSPSNSLELCVGTMAEMTDGGIYEAIDSYSAQKRIAYVHLRNVTGRVPHYRETFIDEGDVDMLRILGILHRNQFDGVVIPDHAPQMTCSAPWNAGMAHTLGYMAAALRMLGCMIVCLAACFGQIADSPPAVVADIPVNYTEANVGTYTLPEVLKGVKSARDWPKRRAEIRKLIEDNWFGRAPGRPKDLSFDVFDRGTPAFGGKALRKQVTIYFTKDKAAGPSMDLLVYLPASAKGPVPLFLNMSFFANNIAVEDPGVKVGRRWDREKRTQVAAEPVANRRFPGLRVEQFVDAGFGIATFNKDDLAPDFLESESMGVKALYLKPGQGKPAADEWGAIAAWAWGASRALDYLETDKGVDARRVALHGVSRLGKTALWAGASDERFAMVIASCSGEGGAAIARRNYGENLAHMSSPKRYNYQFAPNYATYANRVNEWPVDAHMLLALVAPRPLLLQTGNTDKWSDPYGEFLAAVAVEPVYKLLGKRGLETAKFPAAGEAVLHDIGWIMHDGGHGTVPSDFDVYIRFMKMHLAR